MEKAQEDLTYRQGCVDAHLFCYGDSDEEVGCFDNESPQVQLEKKRTALENSEKKFDESKDAYELAAAALNNLPKR